jgi:hypothetical protein
MLPEGLSSCFPRACARASRGPVLMLAEDVSSCLQRAWRSSSAGSWCDSRPLMFSRDLGDNACLAGPSANASGVLALLGVLS